MCESKILHVKKNFKIRLALENIEIIKHQRHHHHTPLYRAIFNINLIKKTFKYSPMYSETEL